jgi:hypothetical protein
MELNIQKKSSIWQKKFCGQYNMKTIDLGNGAECKIYNNGSKCWFVNDKLHRTDGPAIEYASGSKFWYLNGTLHRSDGPAIECANDDKYWFLNGEFHRTDGPAIEHIDGSQEWYINGKQYSEEEFEMAKEVLWAI